MIRFTLFIYLLSNLIFWVGCKENNAAQSKESSILPTATLKNTFADHFTIGAAINDHAINGTDAKAVSLLEKEFNTISPENIMKSMYLQPAKDSFYFEMADKFVDFGERNKMFIVGHAFVWHSQLSPWIEKITDSTEMALALANHIEKVGTRYKGRIDGWDVVNEALNEDGSYRTSVFYNAMGADYLPLAFKKAQEVDPTVELYYNDYNLWKPEKRQGVLNLVKRVRANGGKIDGIGMQAHWSLKGPTIEDIENSILAYSAEGLKVMFTELDITVLPNPWDLEGAEVSQNFAGSPFMNPYSEGLPDSIQIQLADRYEDIFKLFLKHEDKIDRVTFWGINDGASWLNGWPIKDRTNYPLLFDRNYEKKTAYHQIMDLKNIKD